MPRRDIAMRLSLIHIFASIVMQIGIDNCSETVSSVITMSVVFVIMIIGIISVSYTHLDVYKRQVI